MENSAAFGRSGINWKVAAIGVLVIALSLAISPMGWWKLAASLLAVFVLALAQKWPVAMGCLLVGLFVWAAAVEEIRSLIVIFSAPFLVALVALSGHARAAVVFGLLFTYITTTSPFTGQWFPYDFTGAFIYATTVGAGLWGGIYYRRQRLQHATHQEHLRREMEERRERLSRSLHDSVATTLTSVVMRAETLGLTSTHDPEIGRTAELIADETRQAMQEVRHLLHFMQDEELEDSPSINRTIKDQFSVTSRLLRSHGFAVHGDETARECAWSFPPGFEQVFAELATNAIKYGEPGSVIHLTVEQTGSGISCTMANSVRASPSPTHMSSGLGLSQTRHLVSKHRGSMTAGRRNGQWVVEFSIPLSELRR
ncbi:sensor histidine kinase [Corynebacterium qintianiae]|nr:HAMP domain-containing sensor histidine kinase [Corynebacterium qintianiae]